MIRYIDIGLLAELKAKREAFIATHGGDPHVKVSGYHMDRIMDDSLPMRLGKVRKVLRLKERNP